jgi:hypothetical protein
MDRVAGQAQRGQAVAGHLAREARPGASIISPSTMRLTRPIRSASSALTLRPARIILSARFADQPRQTPRTAITRDQAKLDLGQPESRAEPVCHEEQLVNRTLGFAAAAESVSSMAIPISLRARRTRNGADRIWASSSSRSAIVQYRSEK